MLTKLLMYNRHQGRNQLIFSGGAKLCNLLLYLTNTYVCENFGAAIARLPPSGCGPDRYI